MIITIGREFGSGGKEIGQRLAEELNLEFISKERLIQMAKEEGDYEQAPGFYSEDPVNSMICAVSIESCCDKKKNKAFDLIKRIGEKGNCVIIGRCSNTILKENPNSAHIFIHGDVDKRLERIENVYNIKTKKLKNLLVETDDGRRDFHEYYADEEWGLAQNYDLSVNSLSIGIDKTVELIRDYIEIRNLK